MKKALTIIVAIILVVALSVAGTVAYLTSESAKVTNTFSVGKVAITLDETAVTQYGVPVPSATPTTANSYKLVPGQTYTKDPTVHFQPESEASYIFIKVTNGISTIEKAGDTTIAAQITAKGWIAYTGATGVYYKIVDANTSTTEAVDYPVFGSFTVADAADVSTVAADASITIKAAAVQKAGLTLAQAYAEISAKLD